MKLFYIVVKKNDLILIIRNYQMDNLTIKIEKDSIIIKIKRKQLKPLPKKYNSCLEALHDKLKYNI